MAAGRIAQLVEQLTLNQRVQGSNPCAPTNQFGIFLNTFGLSLQPFYPCMGLILANAKDWRRARVPLALWDRKKKVTTTNALMQHAIDYTPYEGMEVTGWPVMIIRRGEVVMRDGKVQAEPGTGRFLPRGPYDMIRPRGVTPDGFDPAPPPAF